MALSPPAARTQIHTRTVVCEGFRRDDGLWDIDARLLDTKTYAFPNHDRGGAIEPGEAIHEMVVRVTVDEHYTIHEVEAETLNAPFNICAQIAPSFAALKGVNMGPGFLRELKARFSGTHGCTHIVELMGPIATTAFQTIAPLSREKMGEATRPRILDTCHALAADGPVVKREWPKFYEGQ